MKTRNILFALTLAITALTACTGKSDEERFVDNLMSKMTIDEKLGQLNLPVTGDIVTGQAQSSNIAEQIRQGKVGGLFNLKGAAAIREVQRIAVEESRLGIPLLFGMDVIHGYETVFPIPLAVACTWDTQAAETMARVSAVEASADGICWTFSPMADVCQDARWGRISEGFGEDPCLSAAMAAAMVRGYQHPECSAGQQLENPATIMACLKHFACYGAPEGGMEYYNVELSRYRMFNDYFPPYRAAVEAGVGSVMASFNTLEGIPSTCNNWLLTELLREQWGFNGMVVADYTAVQELRDHGIAHDKHEAAVMAIKAGMDMDMVSEAFLLLKDKDMQQYVNQACRRILTAKYRLGLFDDPYRYCDTLRCKTDLYTAEHRQTARSVAQKSLVLLKNENNLLPLSKNTRIALIGPLADTRPNMSGTWSVAATPWRYKTLREGLQDAATDKNNVLYAKGCNLTYDPELEARATMFGREMRDTRTDKAMRDEALAIARKADVIVAAMGESSEYSGECTSRTNLDMPDAQHDLLVELRKLGKPIVLLNFSGRPVVLNWENENLPTILQVWFAGSETADAVADVLYGDCSPSGKLAVAFPRSVGQLPMSYRRFRTSRPMDEGRDEFSKFQSSYIDCRNTPLYPFGYGLSYTTFEYSPVTLSANRLNIDQQVKATLTVTNTGDCDADETVQLYIRAMVSNPVRPVKELRDWQRIHLGKGESRQVEFIIDKHMLGFYNADGVYETQPGEYRIMTGPDSQHLQYTSISVE